MRLRQTKGVLVTMVKNKMAFLGLILILGAVFVALAAPLLTPYSPTQQLVSGAFSQPQFMMYFPDGYRLSQNVLAVQDPLFNSPASVQAWTVNATSPVMSNLILSYARGVSSAPTSQGSLQLSYTGASPARVMLSTTFHYPYHGPPYSFLATISYLVTGANASQPVELGLSINKIGDQVFPVWDQNVTTSGAWSVPQAAPLGSNTPYVTSIMGIQHTDLSASQIVFSSVQDYSLQVAITFNAHQTVNLDELQLKLLGTAWGLLGTDFIGADVMSQVIYGTRVSLIVGLTAAGLGIGLGLIVGLMAGFLGSLIDEVLMRFTDMILVIPYLPLLIVLVAVLGASVTNIILVIGLFSWMGFARVIRAQVLSLKERPFIEAARASGAGSGRIMITHIFPNVVSLTYVNLALTVPGAILTEAALEFLGLGDVNTISWGHMFYLAEQQSSLAVWWWVIPPGLAIAAVSLSFVLIGYALDEIFNPRLRRRR